MEDFDFNAEETNLPEKGKILIVGDAWMNEDGSLEFKNWLFGPCKVAQEVRITDNGIQTVKYCGYTKEELWEIYQTDRNSKLN